MRLRNWRILHKWLGLLVFIQVLLWTASGLVISWLDAGVAAGATTRAHEVAPQILDAPSLQPVATLAMRRDDLQSVRLMPVDGRPVYRLRYAQGVRLLDAVTGEAFIIDAERARRIGLDSYSGDGAVTGVERLEYPEELVGFAGAAWAVHFDDNLHTRAYVDANDGRVLGHRNNRSALVEFLLKLHFMDYGGTHDFNNPLIISLGFVTLWLVLSGSLLLVSALRREGLR